MNFDPQAFIKLFFKNQWMYLGVIMFTFLTELRVVFFFNVKLLISFCLSAVPHPPTLRGDGLKISSSTKMLVTKKEVIILILLSCSQRKLTFATYTVVVEFAFMFPNNMNMLLPFELLIIY